MEWRYFFGSTDALHLPSGSHFKVALDRDGETFEVQPVGNAVNLTPQELARLTDGLRQFVVAERRRRELEGLISEKCANLTEAANALSIIGGKTVTTRTIQSWLIEPDKVSSRSCPEWAILALREKTARRGDNPPRKAPRAFVDDPWGAVADVRDRTSVFIATQQLEDEERRLAEWKRTPSADFPAAVAAHEGRLWEWIYAMHERQEHLLAALESSASFDEFKEKEREMRSAAGARRDEIKQARDQIAGE
ncbi:hypothetical protein [Accumulibacter sp.]|uniref:hypothetical protein n=1 Tax=Accumulibacter sp. TaxID=2053492 RepID=UPI002630132E|nr:hypothetical protein [Accumulibacter sp.]